MSKTTKQILGVLSILPIIIGIILIYSMFTSLIPFINELEQSAGQDGPPEEILKMIMGLFGPILLISLLSIGLLIYFIIHIAQDKTATKDDRILWILLLVFFGQLVFPFFWYFRIWKDNEVTKKDDIEILE